MSVCLRYVQLYNSNTCTHFNQIYYVGIVLSSLRIHTILFDNSKFEGNTYKVKPKKYNLIKIGCTHFDHVKTETTKYNIIFVTFKTVHGALYMCKIKTNIILLFKNYWLIKRNLTVARRHF